MVIGDTGFSLWNLVPGTSYVISVSEAAASMIDSVVNGHKKDTLENADMVQIGKAALEKLEAK